MPSTDTDALTPVDLIIARAGGTAPLARLLNVPQSTVWRWVNDPPKTGAGPIPARFHSRILSLAKQRKIRISAAELVTGGVP
jgi:hypothetical protein